MKKALLLLLAAAAGISLMAQPPQSDPRPSMAQGGRVKVLIDNDLCGDGDGLFHLVHQLLCTSSDVRGIVGAHVGARAQAWGQTAGEAAARNNAEISASRASEILELVGKAGTITVKPGAPGPMQDDGTPIESEGLGT